MPSATTKKKTTKKTTSGDPRKRAQQEAPASPATPIPTADDPTSKYAPDAWLSGGIGGMEDLVVPSGQTCLVRRPGLEGLIKAGVLRNVDSLSAIVGEKHIKKAKKGSDQKVNVDSVMKDPKALEEILHTVDKVVCHCVVKPEVFMAPNDVTLRKRGVVYTDMVDINDKMHIFNFVVGGTRDLESFRSGLDDALGGVETGEGVPDEA